MHFPIKFGLALTVAALGLAAVPTHAQTITFDDISPVGPYSLITNPYYSLTWNNFYVANGASTTSVSGGAGFANGVVSGTNEAFSGLSSPAFFTSATPFTFTSGYFTAGFTNQNVTVVGLDNVGNPIAGDSVTFAIVTSGPVLKTFNYTGVYGVDFIPTDHVVVDNLVLNGAPSVPEASTTASFGLLLALGLGGLVIAAKRKKTSA